MLKRHRPYYEWTPDTTKTIAQFNGEYGHTYEFYSIARDNVGYVEDTPDFPDASTTIFWEYICGDSDQSDEVDIDDVVHVINYIFAGGPEPVPYESGDANCSGFVDIDDIVYLISFIFTGGFAPCDTDGDGIPDC